jgi:hypothetical protein
MFQCPEAVLFESKRMLLLQELQTETNFLVTFIDGGMQEVNQILNRTRILLSRNPVTQASNERGIVDKNRHGLRARRVWAQALAIGNT